MLLQPRRSAQPLDVMLRTASSLALVTLISSTVVAGGASWSVKVLSISGVGSDQVELVIEPLEVGYQWKGCDRVTVISTYNPEHIGLRTWSRRLDREKHDEALAALRKAADSHIPVRLGSMGTGFNALADKCKFVSRGLELLTEPSGSLAVYSYYDPI